MDDNIVNSLYSERKQLRLHEYNYSLSGAHFVTIWVHHKQCLFGDIENGMMYLIPYGKIVQSYWNDLTCHYAGISNDIFNAMPNYVHGIILIQDENGRVGLEPAPIKKHLLSEIVRAFKTFSSKGINELRQSLGIVVWQRSFYEHVIRDEQDYHAISEYILNNQAKWESDKENITKI